MTGVAQDSLLPACGYQGVRSLYILIHERVNSCMIKKVVTHRDLHDRSAGAADLRYWLSRPPAERIEAVEALRREHHGSSERLQRTARVVQRA